MQNVHQHPLTPHFVIGDEGFHRARGKRLQQFVFFSEFHACFVIPLAKATRLDAGLYLAVASESQRMQRVEHPANARMLDHSKPCRTSLARLDAGVHSGAPGLPFQPGFFLTCTLAGIKIAFTPASQAICVPDVSAEIRCLWTT